MSKANGFKHTGNGPKRGHFFPSKAGFSGSTGKTRQVRGYSQSIPKRSGVGKVAAGGAGRGPKQNFAEGGKVETIGQAFKMVKELVKRGNSPGDAAKKASTRYNVSMDALSKQVSEANTGGNPQHLARGGTVGMAPRTGPIKPFAQPTTPLQRPVVRQPVAPSRPRALGSFNRNPLVR